MRHPVLCPPADRAFALMRRSLQQDHPDWHLWKSAFNATKTTPAGGVTLVCENWAQLTLELQAEDTAAAIRAAAKGAAA